nr:SDR family oxidoreductase [Actinomycetales bacterium]
MTAPAPARTALVTGASRGIGRHLARGLAEEGLDVAILATDGGRLEEVRAELAANVPAARVVVVPADVTDEREVGLAVARAEEELGGIDLLVNNAGRIDAEVPLWEADPDEWWDVMAVNVRGPFLLARAVVPGMLGRGGGRIVAINSGSGTRDFAEASAYTASKSALFRIGGAIHLAAYERGIRTFELAPGVVHTDMTEGMRLHEGRSEWTDPVEVVALVAALARGDGDHLSGGFLRVGIDHPHELAARTSVRWLGLVDHPAGGTLG